VRAFIGLPAPVEIRARWSVLLPRIKALGVKASWVAPENLHLTVKFLGDVDEARVTEIREALSSSFSALKPVPLACEGIDFFPGERRPRVLFARFSKDRGLLACQENLEEGLGALGFPREDRPFEVHLTLARIKFPWPPAAMEKAVSLLSREPWPAFPLSAAVLYESTLTPLGPIYTPVFTVEAQG